MERRGGEIVELWMLRPSDTSEAMTVVWRISGWTENLTLMFSVAMNLPQHSILICLLSFRKASLKP